MAIAQTGVNLITVHTGSFSTPTHHPTRIHSTLLCSCSFSSTQHRVHSRVILDRRRTTAARLRENSEYALISLLCQLLTSVLACFVSLTCDTSIFRSGLFTSISISPESTVYAFAAAFSITFIIFIIPWSVCTPFSDRDRPRFNRRNSNISPSRASTFDLHGLFVITGISLHVRSTARLFPIFFPLTHFHAF